MFGEILSTITKVVTLPVDVAEIGLDMVSGGDGSREYLKDNLPMPSNLRDKVCEVMEDLD